MSILNAIKNAVHGKAAPVTPTVNGNLMRIHRNSVLEALSINLSYRDRGFLYMFSHHLMDVMSIDDPDELKVYLPIANRVIHARKDTFTTYDEAVAIFDQITHQRNLPFEERMMLAKLEDEGYDGDDEAALLAHDARDILRIHYGVYTDA
jgi:hypothetical protein